MKRTVTAVRSEPVTSSAGTANPYDCKNEEDAEMGVAADHTAGDALATGVNADPLIRLEKPDQNH